jgi:hypothetical protein
VLTYTYVGDGKGNYDVQAGEGGLRSTLCTYAAGGLLSVGLVLLIGAFMVHSGHLDAGASSTDSTSKPFLEGDKSKAAGQVTEPPSDTWLSTTFGAGTATFDSCDTSVAGWEDAWSEGHKWWCCTTWSVGCDVMESAQPPVTTAVPTQGGTSSQSGKAEVGKLVVPREGGEEKAPVATAVEEPLRMCPGSVVVDGMGQVPLVNAMYNVPGKIASGAKVADNVVKAHMNGRTYFGKSCVEESPEYEHKQFMALRLLGKSFRYTVDVSGAGCGCNAALYLTAMNSNKDQSECKDYYCDANEVCGVACEEIDIQEANRHAFYSTLHSKGDKDGSGIGYGAWRHDWDDTKYGPGASCIDTLKPFQVEAAFHTDQSGLLERFQVTLSQEAKHGEGSVCQVSATKNEYTPSNTTRKGLTELSLTMHEGMTPIISYWGDGQDLLWMDGKGNGKGPCAKEPRHCEDTVKFYDFSVTDLHDHAVSV